MCRDPAVAVLVGRRPGLGGGRRRHLLAPAVDLGQHAVDQVPAQVGEVGIGGEAGRGAVHGVAPAGVFELGQRPVVVGGQFTAPEVGDRQVGVDAVDEADQRPRVGPPGCVVPAGRIARHQREQVHQRRQLGVLQLVRERHGDRPGCRRRRHRDGAERVPPGRADRAGRWVRQRRQHRDRLGELDRDRPVPVDQHPPGGRDPGLPDRGGVAVGVARSRRAVEVIEAQLDRQPPVGRPQGRQRRPVWTADPDPAGPADQLRTVGAGDQLDRGRRVRRRRTRPARATPVGRGPVTAPAGARGSGRARPRRRRSRRAIPAARRPGRGGAGRVRCAAPRRRQMDSRGPGRPRPAGGRAETRTRRWSMPVEDVSFPLPARRPHRSTRSFYCVVRPAACGSCPARHRHRRSRRRWLG